MDDSTEGTLSVIEAACRSVERLIGERWQSIGRAADLVWLEFGTRREVIGHRGDVREMGEYALHVQCPWRVLDEDQLVTGSSDIYRPRPGWTGEGDFDWDVHGANRFDVRAAKLTAYLADEPVVVTSVEVTAWGDLVVSLSDEFRIDVLRVGSAREEQWRFFSPQRDEEHLVVSGPLST